jgi:hypothetical protein
MKSIVFKKPLTLEATLSPDQIKEAIKDWLQRQGYDVLSVEFQAKKHSICVDEYHGEWTSSCSFDGATVRIREQKIPPDSY